MNITAPSRRIITLAIGLFFSVALLLMSARPSHASGAYPPSPPTSTSTAAVHQVRGEVTNGASPTRSGTDSRSEASTGFDSVAATGAAIVLVGGGLLLLLVGRRRRSV